MSRIDEVKEHWKEITEKLLGNQENFKDYLSFAGKTFKYSFADSALIYAQQPNATMIADLPTWNKVGRRINRGAKSIAVFGEENNCRYLFDVSDTNGQKAPMQWRLDENLSNDILTEVNETYGLECTNLKDTLSFLTEDTIANYLPELKEFAENMKLSEKQYGSLEKTLISAVQYMVTERCEYNSSLKLSEPPDLQELSLLDRKQFIEFGDKICSIGKETLLNVENTMKNIYQNRRKEN